jgi:nicotinamidase-related amidase
MRRTSRPPTRRIACAEPTERLLEWLDPDEVILFGVATDVCDDAAIRGLDEGRVAACTAAWRERGVEFTTAAEAARSLSSA